MIVESLPPRIDAKLAKLAQLLAPRRLMHGQVGPGFVVLRSVTHRRLGHSCVTKSADRNNRRRENMTVTASENSRAATGATNNNFKERNILVDLPNRSMSAPEGENTADNQYLAPRP